MNRSSRILGLLTLAMIAGGCASPWENKFVPDPDLEGAKSPPTQSVEVRTIPFERYQRYVEAERQRRIASTTAPEDLSHEEQFAAKNRLLEALQLKERGDEVDVLGWSEFVAEEPLSPNDAKLSEFARKIGADYVVVASTYTGQITTTEERPVTTYSHGFTTFTRARGAGRRGTFSTSYSDQTTTWVPMLVTRDQYFYEAIFLRKRRDDARPN